MEMRAAKRSCLQADQDALSSTPPCLLPHLHSVRHCLHPFLSATDAARLMRTSRSIIDLLADYAFADHVFTYDNFYNAADVRRNFAFYARYHMRILRLCLPYDWTEPLVDVVTGRSLLPDSLLALTLGDDSTNGTVVHAALDGEGGEESEEEWDEDIAVNEFYRTLPVEAKAWKGLDWNVKQYSSSHGTFDQPIPPGALPRSLRFLQFAEYAFNQPLQVGSIPDSVEALQFSVHFNHPLQVGHLPASLTHLVLGHNYNHPLLPGVLPSGLRWLDLGGQYSHLLLPGTLPSQLQQLSLSTFYNQPLNPGVIPSSVTHLHLSSSFNQRLQPGSIPEGVVHLELGAAFSHPLLPGMLPTSLRVLVVSQHYKDLFEPGSLPDGLRVLAFDLSSLFQQPLQPGVIPASVSVVSMGTRYSAELVAGGIPSTVRWLQLPAAYAEKDLSGVLSPATRVVWWRRDA